MTGAETTPSMDHVPPLSQGEKALIAKLKGLGGKWSLFVRPHLDGDRPSVAILHPDHGAMIWDVRDWFVPSMHRDDDGLHTGDGRAVLDPIKRLRMVKDRLYKDYVPGWAEALDQDDHVYGIVRAGLYLPLATRLDLHRLAWSGLNEIVISGDEWPSTFLDRLIPNLNRTVAMKREWHDALKLAFSEYHPPQFGGLRPSSRQRDLINREHRSGWWGINGIAGSGKSLVLTRRATALAAKGHRVLLVTYNVTLANYCRALVADSPDGFRTDLVTVRHFHGLGAALLQAVGLPAPHPNGPHIGDEANPDDPSQGRLQHHYDVAWPAAMRAAMALGGRPVDFEFDTVLVDEAQDFAPAYLDALQSIGLPEAEFTLAFDTAQRLYARSDGLDRLDRRRISNLDRTWRMSPQLANIATTLGDHLGVDAPPIIVDEEAAGLFDASQALWIDVDGDAAALVAVRDLVNAWRAEPGHRPDSVAILVRSIELGLALVEFLAASDIATNHILPVFNRAQRPSATQRRERARRHKTSFTPHDQRTKVSTIHSYKGWDAERIILVQPRFDANPNSAAVIYVAVTRPHTALVIVSARDVPNVRQLFDTRASKPSDEALRQASDLLEVARAHVEGDPIAPQNREGP